MKHSCTFFALLIITGLLGAQTPDLGQVLQYRNKFREILKGVLADRSAWEQAIRDQNVSDIKRTFDAFCRSASEAYKTIQNIPVMEGDPGYHAACEEFALEMFMGCEDRIEYITRVALDNQRTSWEVEQMDTKWADYWYYETHADKKMELAEYDLFSHFLEGSSSETLCNAIQSVLTEAGSGFIKYKGEPTESPFDGIAAFATNWLMPGASKGIWFSGSDDHRFLVFTFLQEEDRAKALGFYSALCVDFVSCAFPDWNRDVYRPDFGETNPPDLNWVSYESPDSEMQVRVVMGKPKGKDFYRVQIRFDVPSQY